MNNEINFTLKLVEDNNDNTRKRCCCNCGNNKRIKQEDGYVRCECDIDGHYIRYVACFEDWCRRWRKNKFI